MILAIRTDSSEATLQLYEQDSHTMLTEKVWEAGRQLSDQLLSEITALVQSQGADLQALTGIIVYQGPGSFTGLRIGITVANTLADSLGVPIAGATGDEWVQNGFMTLQSQKLGDFVTPEYGGEANITKPRK